MDESRDGSASGEKLKGRGGGSSAMGAGEGWPWGRGVAEGIVSQPLSSHPSPATGSRGLIPQAAGDQPSQKRARRRGQE